MPKISAQVRNKQGDHQVELQTNQKRHSIQIAPKPGGFGSSVNGGELLFLALATCYCNDVYREAAKKNIPVTSVEVSVEGDFGAEGEPAKNIQYSVKVVAQASQAEVMELLKYTDHVAEIHNTLRVGTQVKFVDCEVQEAR